MYVVLEKNCKLATDSLSNYDDLHQDVFWYLLTQTRVNSIMCRNSLREFLIRYLLISEHPLDQTAEEFINEGLLISGTLGDQVFCFYLKDVFHFFGFASTSARYQVEGSLGDFIKTYRNKKYLISIEAGDSGEVKISEDVLILKLAGLERLIQIDTLNIRFKEDLIGVSVRVLTRVSHFVDYVLHQVSSEVFSTYQDKFTTELNYYKEYYYKENVINFDPWTQLPKDKLVSLFEHLLGPNHHLVQGFRDVEVTHEDVLHDLMFQIPYIKFAYELNMDM